MREGVFAALDAIEQATGEREVAAIGYCVGGTLLAVTLAYMAAIGDKRIASATFFATRSISPTPAISRCSSTPSS